MFDFVWIVTFLPLLPNAGICKVELLSCEPKYRKSAFLGVGFPGRGLEIGIHEVLFLTR